MRVWAMVMPVMMAGAAWGYVYDSADFATRVVEYQSGVGPATDFVTGQPCTDPTRALGRPTVDTTGDLFNMPLTETVPVVPVYGAFRASEVVSLGAGGKLVVAFDRVVRNDAANPFGVDLIVFGNARVGVSWPANGYWINRDPAGAIVGGMGFSENAVVSVSKDGVSWHAFSGGPFADGFAPTLGRVYDPANADPAVGAFNQWWGEAADPTLPLDPAIGAAMFMGKTVGEVAAMYGRSAGGTGFDIGLLGLDWIQYVMVENPVGNGMSPEIDAIADVAAVPEPGVVGLVVVALGMMRRRRRRVD